MKWFKHMVASGDDPDIDDAISIFGTDGYYVFFRTLEIMSREFDPKNPGKNRFSVTFFRKKFRISWRKVLKILEYFAEKKRIMYEISNGRKLDYIDLNCPNLKKHCDEFTQRIMKKYENKLGSDSGVARDLEAEAEQEAEADYLKKHILKNDFLKSEEIEFASEKKICDLINQVSDDLKLRGVFKNVDVFVGKMKKQNVNSRAVLHSLIRCSIKNQFTSTPWHYCQSIIKMENGNYNERENRKTKN